MTIAPAILLASLLLSPAPARADPAPPIPVAIAPSAADQLLTLRARAMLKLGHRPRYLRRAADEDVMMLRDGTAELISIPVLSFLAESPTAELRVWAPYPEHTPDGYNHYHIGLGGDERGTFVLGFLDAFRRNILIRPAGSPPVMVAVIRPPPTHYRQSLGEILESMSPALSALVTLPLALFKHGQGLGDFGVMVAMGITLVGTAIDLLILACLGTGGSRTSRVFMVATPAKAVLLSMVAAQVAFIVIFPFAYGGILYAALSKQEVRGVRLAAALVLLLGETLALAGFGSMLFCVC